MGAQKAASGKEKFNRWFKNKKKSPSEKTVGPPRKNKGKGKGQDKGKGGKDKGKGGKEKGKWSTVESSKGKGPSLSLNSDDMGKAGVPRLFLEHFKALGHLWCFLDLQWHAYFTM